MARAISRRQFLTAGAALATQGALPGPAASSTEAVTVFRRRPRLGRPHIILLWTDQERHPQHWPEGWVEANLPSSNRLKRHGLSFVNAFTAAAQCTPSRATFLTSTYPTVNGVTNTLVYPLQSLQQNLATIMAAAGYEVAYKGKWHLSLPVQLGATGTFEPPPPAWSEQDIEHLATTYGAAQWNPPDAGNTEFDVTTLGGGLPNHDGRYMSGAPGAVIGFGESVLDFLARQRDATRPFCLFVSLVNPHDVSVFPRLYEQGGYALDDFRNSGIDLPANVTDSLATKPRIQTIFRDFFATDSQGGALPSTQDQLDYVNFYAHLHTVVDRHLVHLLDALDAFGLTENTVIFRFSDHGEQGLSHGLRQKMFSAYEETIRVPLIVSSPLLFPRPVVTQSFASLLDLLPTVAGLAGVSRAELKTYGVKGRNLAPILHNPRARVQDSVLFTFDDWIGPIAPFLEQMEGVPGHIRCVRAGRWMYAVYFTLDGSAFDYELYDLRADSGQLDNLAASRDPAAVRERGRLHRLLTQLLIDAEALPGGFAWPPAP